MEQNPPYLTKESFVRLNHGPYRLNIRMSLTDNKMKLHNFQVVYTYL